MLFRSCGEFESVEEATSRVVKVIDTVEPEDVLVEKYEIKYNKFKEIYPTVKKLFSELS